jgi:hypothetical protein
LTASRPRPCPQSLLEPGGAPLKPARAQSDRAYGPRVRFPGVPRSPQGT